MEETNLKNKKKLALVLAGGGSLGAYEVGAISALEELGYKFDIVTGTSIGGLNGAFVAGHRTDRLKALWESITPEKVMRDGVNLSAREAQASTASSLLSSFSKFAGVYLRGNQAGADITPFKEFIKDCLDVDACLNSDITFGVIATKFPSKKMVDIDMNKVAKEDFQAYLHCTSACFPIFPIETVHDIRYIDGFYTDNLPIRLAFKYGAEEVIAIDMRLFQLKPQNEFYLKLPNVTYIAPYINFGSLMDFHQDVIRPNIQLGYLDVMKHFKKYRGYTFAFNDSYIAQGFMSHLLSTYGLDAKFIIENLTKDIRTPMDETDYFIRALELIGLHVGIKEYYKTFTIREFIELIKNKSVEMSATAGFGGSLKKMLGSFKKNIEIFKGDRVMNHFMRHFASTYLSISVVNNSPLSFGETSDEYEKPKEEDAE